MARTKKVTSDTIVVVGASKGLQGYLYFNRNRKKGHSKGQYISRVGEFAYFKIIFIRGRL